MNSYPESCRHISIELFEANHVLEARLRYGRGHVNFYRVLREEEGVPVPHRREKKVKSATLPPQEKVKFPTPPEPEKVKSEPRNGLELLGNTAAKIIENKERKDKADATVSLSPHDGADAPEDAAISPEVMRKFNLRYNVADWPPLRRE